MNEQELYDSLAKHGVRSNLRPGIVRYILSGIKPGSFLTHVITGNLAAVLSADDDVTMDELRVLYRWFYNEAPSPCWKSVEAMNKWIEAKREEFKVGRKEN